MRYLILLYITLQHLMGFSQNLDHDTILVGKRTNFLDDLSKRNEYIYPVLGYTTSIVKPKDGLHAAKPSILLKSGHTLFLTFVGSGRIYKEVARTDSSYIFKRIDSTHNVNYNLAAYYFTNHGDIYCYGGYGFWKNNGVLKVFTESTHEWNVIPLNREVIGQNFPSQNSWYHPKEEKLYVLYHCPTNAGISGKENLIGKIKNDVEVLDLTSRTWTKMGETSDEIVALGKSFSGVYQYSKGLMLLLYDDLFLLDITNNKVLKLDDNILVQRLMRMAMDKNIYTSNDHIYFYDPNIHKYDSIFIDPKKFKVQSYPIWHQSISPLWYTIPGILIVLYIILFYIRKNTKKKIQVQEEKQKSFQLHFNDTELALLQLLIKKTNESSTATIAEINYVLGVKDKNTGLQKKVRSDVFNSVNEKYKFYAGLDESLIQSIRSEEDKRFLEYMISADRINDIQSMLDKLH